MRLPLSARRPLLLIHLLGGVGWFGAVVAYLVLAVVGLVDADPALSRASYQAMALIVWFVVTPLSLVGLASGIVQALGTPWGVGRHWWVFLKLVMTVLSIAILLLHLGPTDILAQAARHGDLTLALGRLRVQLVVAPSAALLVLTTTAALGVIKPKGLTPWSRMRGQETRSSSC